MDKGIYFIPREFWPNYYLPPNHLHLHSDLISIERLLFPTSYFIYLKYRTITIKNKKKHSYDKVAFHKDGKAWIQKEIQ